MVSDNKDIEDIKKYLNFVGNDKYNISKIWGYILKYYNNNSIPNIPQAIKFLQVVYGSDFIKIEKDIIRMIEVEMYKIIKEGFYYEHQQ